LNSDGLHHGFGMVGEATRSGGACSASSSAEQLASLLGVDYRGRCALITSSRSWLGTHGFGFGLVGSGKCPRYSPGLGFGAGRGLVGSGKCPLYSLDRTLGTGRGFGAGSGKCPTYCLVISCPPPQPCLTYPQRRRGFLCALATVVGVLFAFDAGFGIGIGKLAGFGSGPGRVAGLGSGIGSVDLVLIGYLLSSPCRAVRGSARVEGPV
jgi:hypothetical protein